MKKILYTLLAAALFMPAVSCTDMLDEKPLMNLDRDDYMYNAMEVENVLLGIYSCLNNNALYGYNLSMLLPLSTDIAQCEGASSTNFREIPTNAHSPSNSDIQATWRYLYNGVYSANDFIERATKSMRDFPAGDRQLAELYVAEAKVLRAMFYFDLVRWFGNITLMTTAAESLNDPKTFTQNDPAEVYAFIEQDLKDAADALPWNGDIDPRGDTQFRFTKGSALGLLSKVYATWAGWPVQDQSKWDLSAKTALKVISSMKHSLLPNFEDLWYNTCSGWWNPAESLIEVSFYSTTNAALGYVGKWNGVQADAIVGKRASNSARTKVVETFMTEWKGRNDPRYGVSVAEYQYVGTLQWPWSYQNYPNTAARNNWQQLCTPGKWNTEKYVDRTNYLIDASYSRINWYILRYSDVLLTYAEAVNESQQGPTADAIGAVNLVRRRGYGIDPGTASSQSDINSSAGYDEFKTIIQKERAYELCFEGHRKHDLVRWGIYTERIRETAISLLEWSAAANYTVVSNTVKGKHELLPIPQREIDLMPNYEQNPNWGK